MVPESQFGIFFCQRTIWTWILNLIVWWILLTQISAPNFSSLVILIEWFSPPMTIRFFLIFRIFNRSEAQNIISHLLWKSQAFYNFFFLSFGLYFNSETQDRHRDKKSIQENMIFFTLDAILRSKVTLCPLPPIAMFQ